MPVVEEYQAALDRALLLEEEKQSGLFFVADASELLKGDMTSRFNAYASALQNNIMSINEVRYRENLPPLDFDYMKLGLADVLFDPQTGRLITPNTGITQNARTGLTTKSESAIIEEERTRHWIKGDHGYFAGLYSDGNSGGTGGLTNSGGGGIMSVGSGDELEQAKTRDKKIIITDIAIEKANAPDIPFLSEEQNQRFKELNKELLRKAKYENDSNEVAILFDPGSLTYQMKFGDVSSVNVFNNPLARDMIRNADEKSLFLLHNHPSTKNFSYTDIGVLLTNDSYAGMTAVANTGVISVVYKTARYDRNLALKVIKDIRINYPQILSGSDDVEIV